MTMSYEGTPWIGAELFSLALFGQRVMGWDSLHELHTWRKRQSWPNLQSLLNLLYFMHTGESDPALLVD